MTTLRFSSRAGATFLDLKPVSLAALSLDGRPLDVDLLERGRFPLELTEGEHELVVEATMPFRNDGEGLHRSVDPADGKHYVYGMSFMDAAPTIFACFDQPDLKAPYTFHVRAPQDWVVIGNAPGRQVEKGVWEFEQSQPLSTYFVTLVAGPYHVIRDEHDGIPLGLSARASIAADLDKDADELFTLTKQSFDELHRLFGIRYPFGDYHQAFVPEFNAGAMENPGCVTFRDPLIFTSRVTRGVRIARASTLAHEMAHQWFGNLVTPAWWDDLWLNESFAEYLGNRVTADVTEYADAWVDNAYARRQWGLVADQRPSTHPVAGNGAVDASAALQDFDGISYAKGCAILRQLNATLGDEVFFKGTIDHFEQPPLRQRHDARPLRELGARRSRATCRTSPTTGCAPPARTGSSSTARPASSAVRRPRTIPPTGRTASARRSRTADGTWTDQVLELEDPETPVRRRRPAGAARPLQRHLGAADPRQADHGRAREPAPPHHGSRAPRRALEQHPQRAAQRRRRPGRRARGRRREPAGRGHRGQPRAARWPGSTAGSCRCSPTPRPRGRAARRRAWPSSTTAAPTSEEQLAALPGAVIGTAPTRSCFAAGSTATGLPDGVPLDLDLRWRVLVRLATLGAVDLAELDRQLDAEPTSGRPGAPRRRARVAARTRRPRRGPGRASPVRSTCPTTSSRRWASASGAAARRSSPTPYVERYFADLPDTVKVRSGWVLADAAEDFFPRTSMTRETLARAEALIADGDLDLSIRRRLVDEADTLERQLAVLAAYPRA